jgi:hypothetical protein
MLANMTARTELLLYALLWACDSILRPSWRNLGDSYESWAYRNGFLRQIQRLEEERYAAYRRVLDERPRGALDTVTAGKAFTAWLRDERERWTEAIESDPFLPESLWPRDYVGRDVWQRRLDAMADAGRQMRSFSLPQNRDNKINGR